MYTGGVIIGGPYWIGVILQSFLLDDNSDIGCEEFYTVGNVILLDLGVKGVALFDIGV